MRRKGTETKVRMWKVACNWSYALVRYENYIDIGIAIYVCHVQSCDRKKAPVQHLTMWKSNFHVFAIRVCFVQFQAFGRCRRTEINVLYLCEQKKNNIYKNLSELWTLTRIYLTMKSNKKPTDSTSSSEKIHSIIVKIESWKVH